MWTRIERHGSPLPGAPGLHTTVEWVCHDGERGTVVASYIKLPRKRLYFYTATIVHAL